MPWTADDLPESLARLAPEVRDRALEIANALVEEGYDEASALEIATSQAQDSEDRRMAAEPAVPIHVVPHADGWVVRREGEERFLARFDTRKAAIDHATMLSEDQVRVIVHGRRERRRAVDPLGGG